MANRTSTRTEHDNGLGISGLRRIRRQGPPSRSSTIIFDEVDFTPASLQQSYTMPISGTTSRSGSRSASAAFLASGPSSPVLEDLHRFPSESLHSFSFAQKTEDFLHSRQAILQKSVDFMRDRSGWAANPGLASAQAKVSGDSEIQGMMDLLRRAKVVPSLDIKAAQHRGAGLGPMTGPADFEGPNIFEKSFSNTLEPVNSSPRSSLDEDGEEQRASLAHAQNAAGPPVVADPSGGQHRKSGLKRTYTDVHSMTLQQKLIEALAQPYTSDELQPKAGKDLPTLVSPTGPTSAASSSLHGHNGKWTPPAQAVFRTTADAPWTILAANDLACLTFGVTRAEVRHLSILGVIQEDRRRWLEDKLRQQELVAEAAASTTTNAIANGSSSLLGARGGGITARLLSKAPSRGKPKQNAQADVSGGNTKAAPTKNHPPTKSRGVLLCGDILPTRKRDGTLGAASFWVMEKRGGLIWVVEEITEDLAFLRFDERHRLTESKGAAETIWGSPLDRGASLRTLIPNFPLEALNDAGYDEQPLIDYYTASTLGGVNVPISVGKGTDKNELRISSLPHIAGVMIIEPQSLKITSSNSVFSAALFGYDKPNGLPISDLIPDFAGILEALIEDADQELVEGIVIPEHSFRRARALLALRESTEQAASIFLRPAGLQAKHRDGSDIMVDVQMRVVRSETVFPLPEDVIVEEEATIGAGSQLAVNELVYAIWVTYSRQLHSASLGVHRPEHPLTARPLTPPSQPIPLLPSPPPTVETSKNMSDQIATMATRMEEPSPIEPLEPLEHPPPNIPYVPHEKKTINDFVVLEEMGKGAYGEVKLARYKKSRSRKIVLKYVVKKRILVDTWTRDRRLGTVPLEIHVLDYLRQPGLRHPNIVEMIDFFEDDINYYIEMLPHGLPGMDLFDYIELRSNMEETECRNIFRQVVDAIHHLHIKAKVVHRDVKDENVVLDGEGQIKLIDFGSATYIKNGPFDVFVGTLDYAAPEVLQGRPYAGPEQDVWALGILLYTLLFRENPFYNIDEILDHPLRVPYVPFSELCIDLCRKMLDRDVEQRLSIDEVRDHEWLKQE